MCDCCTVGVTLSAMGVGFCGFALFFTLIAFIQVGTLTLYSDGAFGMDGGCLVNKTA